MYQQNESKNRTQNETLDGFLACYFWTLLKQAEKLKSRERSPDVDRLNSR